MRALALTAALLAGCSAGSLSPEEQQQRCASFADTVAEADLGTTPDEEVANRTADKLDAQLSRLGSPAVHGPAVRLHGDLHNVAAAMKRGDRRRADQAAAKARNNINVMATACGLPSSRWFPSSP